MASGRRSGPATVALGLVLVASACSSDGPDPAGTVAPSASTAVPSGGAASTGPTTSSGPSASADPTSTAAASAPAGTPVPTAAPPGAAPDAAPPAQPPAVSATPRPAPPAPRPAVSAIPRFRASVSGVTAADLPASWRAGCPLDVAQLRAVDVTHWGLDGAVHTGRLVVAADVAESVVTVMADLFDAGYPIERMRPVDAYGGDDDASMAANNTSAFNCRRTTGGSSWSEHSYGRAIDVNPLLNPYVNGGTVLPPAGTRYADRSRDVPGMIHAGDEVVRAFAARGWVWGGTWDALKDYQHFSTSGR